MFDKTTIPVLAALFVFVASLMTVGADSARAVILVSEGFDGYAPGTHTSVAPPPSPGNFPTLNGPAGWGTPFRSHIGAGLQIEISAGPSGGLYDGPSFAGAGRDSWTWWRDRIMASPVHPHNPDGAVSWQSVKLSTAGSSYGGLRVQNQHGGIQYEISLDGGNVYQVAFGHGTTPVSTGVAPSTSFNSPDFILARTENVAGNQVQTDIWINPDLSGGEAGLGAPTSSATYDPFAGNRTIKQINTNPGQNNVRLDNIVFGETYADAIPDYTWADPTTGGAWETDTNWTGHPGIPNGVTDRVIFAQPTSANASPHHAVTVDVSGGKTLRSLIFDGPNRVNLERTSYTIDGDPLAFAPGGDITHEAFRTWSVVHQTINNDVVMMGDLSINMNWDSLNQTGLYLNGTITGSGRLTLDNTHSPTGGTQTGRLHLRGNSSSTFTGEVVINGGSIMLYTGSLGDTVTGTTINSGSIMGATAEDFTINGPASFQSYGGNRVYSGDVLINATGSLELNPGGNQLTASGDISGAGGVTTVSGHPNSAIPGHVWITGNNTFAGTLALTERPGGAGGTGVTLNGSMAHSDIIVGPGVTLDGSATILFSEGDAIDVDGLLDAENMQFDLMALLGPSAILVDYVDGAYTIGGLADLDDLLTTPSYDAGWRLTDTGTLITAALPPLIIPEPAAFLIWSLLAGLAIGAGWRRRRK